MNNNFFFNKVGNLVVNRSHSNIFITLLDKNNKVVICKSSGACDVGNSKKKKKSPQALENIVSKLINYFEMYNIKGLNIILKVKFSSHIVILVKELTDRGIKILKFINRQRVGHNGMRGRKIRRI